MQPLNSKNSLELCKIRSPLLYSFTRKSGVKYKLRRPVVGKLNSVAIPVTGFGHHLRYQQC
jgi:hypothetical protein